MEKKDLDKEEYPLYLEPSDNAQRWAIILMTDYRSFLGKLAEEIGKELSPTENRHFGNFLTALEELARTGKKNPEALRAGFKFFEHFKDSRLVVALDSIAQDLGFTSTILRNPPASYKSLG